MRPTSRVLLVSCSIAAACGGSPNVKGPPGYEDRPYEVGVRWDRDPSVPTALLLVLHGYGSSAADIDRWWPTTGLAVSRDILVVRPQGTRDRSGLYFWNADDACCDFYHTGVDDVGYLRAVIADVSAHYAVDPKRVYVTGHSNGAFMAHRLGCDAADVVAAIAPVSGLVWKDPSRCRPSAPMPVLEVIGTVDGNWSGGEADMPSEAENIATWAALDGCTGDLVDTGGRLDLVTDQEGAETRVSRHVCPQGAAVEEWAMQGVGHLFTPRIPEFNDRIMDWLEAHRRP